MTYAKRPSSAPTRRRANPFPPLRRGGGGGAWSGDPRPAPFAMPFAGPFIVSSPWGEVARRASEVRRHRYITLVVCPPLPARAR